MKPGAVIGIIGGGQLGRMLASAAARLGFATVVLDPDPACPAAQLASRVIIGSYGDTAALAELAKACDVISYEFENVPIEPVSRIAGLRPVYPPVQALEVSQDRVVEKAFLNGIGIATAPWRAVDDAQELAHARLDLGGDCILKTRRFGYDGKGQMTLDAADERDDGFEALGSVAAILEKKIPFEREISVVAARDLQGTIRCFDPAENVHRAGILHTSTVPASISAQTADQAADIAGRILTQLDYTGVIGVEFFVSGDGALLVNEIAPRVHNSGHWTEAAVTVSQFEQHIRAIAGLPLGSTQRHSDCVMQNLIGDDVLQTDALLQQSDLMLTLYGKAEVRAGRKMGHFTVVHPRPNH
ncbi:5-(carboxyamino)imidazole ribonucleotide synthase [Aureimonas fodinaquatilis]|uniref:N5-carboxyaminoimidazole ribonucleotide synthase n=1 Tax=Aureimonas fodinaquatilis TaxID=2565783 RepID=A0A5B0E235_9HYPH|nr:5-(carboxyamino)imidazole ribonucleotide synthase [Aureimonas fodinaquatilis]